MFSKKIFREQNVIRAFAFASACLCAACASNGSLNPSAQQTLAQTCDKAAGAIAVAGFFESKMTPAEVHLYNAAQLSEENFCSPSALAADLTPAAVSANITALGQVVQSMQGISSAHAPTSPASEVSGT